MKKYFLWICLSFVIATSAFGVDLFNLYRGSCQVSTGLILSVSYDNILFLDVSGKAEIIPRHQVVGLTSYSLPEFRLHRVDIPQNLPLVRFYGKDPTQVNGLKVLAVGWPIEFSNLYIHLLDYQSLLRQSSTMDAVIRRDDIWKIEFVPRKKKAFSLNTPPNPVLGLSHPHGFHQCPTTYIGAKSGDLKNTPAPIFFPRDSLLRPLELKRFLDHLMEGHRKIKEYEDRQGFYQVPQIYTNRTQMGTWAMLNSRYGNVGARQINFLPLVVDEYSEGPFDYQRIIRTGVYPISWGTHAEPMLQVYYGVKVDYIHFNFFIDPSRILIGDEYYYSRNHLNTFDVRMVEVGGLDFGFDFGKMSLSVLSTSGEQALRAQDYFYKFDYDLARFAFRFHFNEYTLMLTSGYSHSPEVEIIDLPTQGNTVGEDSFAQSRLDVKSMHLSGPLGPQTQFSAMVIRRSIEDITDHATRARFDTSTTSLSGMFSYDLDYRWRFLGWASYENVNLKAVLSGNQEENKNLSHIKAAGGVLLSF